MTIQQSLRSHLVIGISAVALLVVIIFGWGTLSEISGAVIAPGKLVVDSNVKKVQHPHGGVVGRILVIERGARRRGDVLIVLDDTQTRLA